MLHGDPACDVLPSSLALLLAEMRLGFNVSQDALFELFNFKFCSSICLVVISLLTETPHDVRYYWK
jgi:hypothetical protein